MTSCDDRALMHGKDHRFEPKWVCSSCGEENKTALSKEVSGTRQGYCPGCQEYRDFITEDDYLATHPEDAAPYSAANDYGLPPYTEETL